MTYIKGLGRRNSALAAFSAILIVSGCAQNSVEPDSGMIASASAPPVLPAPQYGASASGSASMIEGHPARYTVKPGDTLWDISGHFLASPWRWKEIWSGNPQVKNPHLIYPGDVLEVFSDGEGKKRVRVAGGRRATVKLSPQIRYESLNQAVPTVPLDSVKGFLNKSEILDEGDWVGIPYIVAAADERLASGTGNRVFAKGDDFDSVAFRVFRPGKQLTNPETDEVIGVDAIYMATAVVEDLNDEIATLNITQSVGPVLPGDRLLPAEEEVTAAFFLPESAPLDTEGTVIGVQDGVSLIGLHATVVLNLGDSDSIKPGHVFKVMESGRLVADPLARTNAPAIQLPDQESGTVMVYKVFENASYALVMDAPRPFRVLDKVVTP